MARDNGVEIQKLVSVTSSLEQIATFEGGIQTLAVTSDQDIFISFDQNPATSSGFLVKGSVANNPLNFLGNNIQKIRVIASSATTNVYLLGIRGST